MPKLTSELAAAELRTAPAPDLSGGLDTPIRRVWSSPLYLTGLTIVSLVMLLLPMLYVALIAVTAWGVYAHAVNDLWIMTEGWGTFSGRGRVVIFMFLLRATAYLGPIVIGLVVIAFMIKPFFARPADRDKSISFVRENEPALFGFIEALCNAVHAPHPRRIDMDFELNASAHFRRGFLSFLGGDLVLTLGAPLVAGITLRQLAGVVAHELGHFSQGFGMRLTYTIHRINRWFARVVYERDSWDESLTLMSHNESLGIQIVFMLARLFVWLTRRILYGLMWIAHLVSCGMSRQMEHQADLYAIRLIGSDEFEAFMRRMSRLAIAQAAAFHDLSDSWREKRLPDNMPMLIAHRADELPEDLCRKIDENVAGEKVGLFSLHPSTGSRIQAAQRLADPGVFRREEPATALFRDFESVARTATLTYYREALGPRFDPQSLISVHTLTKKRDARRKSGKRADQYFHGCLTPLARVVIDPYSERFRLPPETCRKQLAAASAALEKASKSTRQVFERFGELSNRRFQSYYNMGVLMTGVTPGKSMDKSLPRTIEEARRQRREVESQLESLDPRMRKILEAQRLCLEFTLALVQGDGVSLKIKDPGRLRKRCRRLVEGLAQINAIGDSLSEIRQRHVLIDGIADGIANRELEESVAERLLYEMNGQCDDLKEVSSTLREAPYPFDDTGTNVTMARYAIASIPAKNDLGCVLSVASGFLEAMDKLYLRIMGELATVAVAVEQALKSHDLPDTRKTA